MTSTISVAEGYRVWGTFDDVKEHLSNQFKDIPFEQDSGLSVHELERDVEEYLAANADRPRVLQKANVFRIVATRGQICIDPSDWFADKLNHGNLLRKLTLGTFYTHKFSEGRWLDEATSGIIAEGTAWFEQTRDIGLTSGPRGGLDLGHISPGWETLLEGGLTGLLDRVSEARTSLGSDATEDQLAFYEAVETVYHATIELANRFAALAEQMVPDYPEQESRLKEIASACRRVPANAPRTFHEALQFLWTTHQLIEMEGENVRSMGHFDRTLYPYYKADIDSGRLTRDQAKELIKFFWYKWFANTQGAENGKNFVFGGQYPDGSVLTNDLTYVAFEAYGDLHTPDPKLSVRFVPETEDRLYETVTDLIRNGNNSFVLMNDVPAVEALVRRGKTVEDARTYLPIGCYEPAVEGKEAACTMNVTVNLTKPLELALHDGKDPLSGKQIGPHTGDPRRFETFEQLEDAYFQQLDFVLATSSKFIGEAERAWPQINPSPWIAATIDDCIARGMDVGQGGPVYNTVGFVGAGLANAGDSLMALKQAVYDEKRFTMAQMVDATDADFDGLENMRLYLVNRTPKWGNNNPQADAMATSIADHYFETVHSFTNGRGGIAQAALFTLTFAIQGGKKTGALPDGRKAGESLAPGVGSTYGQDKKGATALIDSVTKLDFNQTPNGSVLDVTLHPTAVAGEEGLDAFVSLIKTFFSKGGYAIQFNVFDAETLRDAQRHPERYASLQIRVTGWSVYFTTMSKEEQDLFIARIAHGA
ncbi:MAG: pyruvate formate lyase family protein [SAR202 cluster bacterium]|nr:pyruvate formate lyase family protein [SAR202 cluster bacterium]